MADIRVFNGNTPFIKVLAPKRMQKKRESNMSLGKG